MRFNKILFSILAIFTLLFVACGKKEAPTEDANTQQTELSKTIEDFHVGVVTVSVSQA